MNTRQLSLNDLQHIPSLISSYNPTLTSYHSVGSFNHCSVEQKKKLGKYALEKMNLVSRFFTSTYYPGDLHKQRIVTNKCIRSFFASQEILQPYIQYGDNLLRLIIKNNLKYNTKCLRELFIKSVEWINNTEHNRPGFQIRNGLLVKVGEFGYKKFRNCDREYEVNGLGPLSSATRDIIIQLMDIDATDLDQVSSSPNIFLQLLDRAVLKAELNDEHQNAADLEKGRVHLQNALKRKEAGEVGLKEMLNPTMYGCREYLKDTDMNGIHLLLRDYLRIEGGFETFGHAAKSWLSHQILHIENKLQRTFEKYLAEMGIKTLSHVYDGCIVLGNPTSEQIELAERKTQEEVGFNMKWKVKKEWKNA